MCRCRCIGALVHWSIGACVQRCRGAEVQRCFSAEVQRYRGVEMYRCRVVASESPCQQGDKNSASFLGVMAQGVVGTNVVLL